MKYQSHSMTIPTAVTPAVATVGAPNWRARMVENATAARGKSAVTTKKANINTIGGFHSGISAVFSNPIW